MLRRCSGNAHVLELHQVDTNIHRYSGLTHTYVYVVPELHQLDTRAYYVGARAAPGRHWPISYARGHPA